MIFPTKWMKRWFFQLLILIFSNLELELVAAVLVLVLVEAVLVEAVLAEAVLVDAVLVDTVLVGRNILKT